MMNSVCKFAWGGPQNPTNQDKKVSLYLAANLATSQLKNFRLLH